MGPYGPPSPLCFAYCKSFDLHKQSCEMGLFGLPVIVSALALVIVVWLVVVMLIVVPVIVVGRLSVVRMR